MMVLPFAEQVRKLCLETIRAAEKLPDMGSTINKPMMFIFIVNIVRTGVVREIVLPFLCLTLLNYRI